MRNRVRRSSPASSDAATPDVQASVQYDDHHRHFLQALMSRRCVCSSGDVWRLYEQACRRVAVPARRDQLAAFVNTINGRLGALGLRIVKGCCEWDGGSYYVLANCQRPTAEASPSLPSAAACYSPQELRLLQQLMAELTAAAGRADELEAADGDDSQTPGTISELAAVRLATCGNSTYGGGMRPSEAHAALQKLVDDCWLLRLPKRRLALHVRTTVELAPELMRRYGDVVCQCSLCRQVCVLGWRCVKCGGKWHRHCMHKYTHSLQDTGACPGCRAASTPSTSSSR